MWTDNEQLVLRDLLDRLIPPNPALQIPGAGQVGLTAHLAQVAADDPDFVAGLRSALSGPKPAAASGLADHLSACHPQLFTTLLRHVYMGYYSRPDIRAALGLSQAPTQPAGYPVLAEPAEFLADLTAPVVARGPIYRQTGTGGGQR